MTEQSPDTMEHLLSELVVGVDGSDASTIAFEWACAQAGGAGHITAVHGVPALSEHFAEIPQASIDALLAARHALLEGNWIAQPEHLTATSVSTSLSDKEPATALQEMASTRSGAVIVIGHHAHHRWSQNHIGSLATQLIHTSNCPVIITNDATQAEPIHGPIAVCVRHDNAPSHESIVFATRLATERGLELHLLSVTEPLPVGPGRGYPAKIYERDLATVHSANVAALDSLKAQLRAADPQLVIASRVFKGYPTTVLVDAIADLKPSLTVLGRHHPSRLAAMFADAVTRHLPAVLDTPVAIIPVI